MISIIIPVLNEKELLALCVDRLVHSVFDGEIIVVDGGSRDGSVAAARLPGVLVKEAAPGRARQMNAGAGVARGETLLFLHVDTILPPDFHEDIERATGPGGAAGGAFTLAIDGEGFFYRFIEKTANFRSRRMGVVFGDQAIFATREAFSSVGGYPDLPVMEDCAFVDRLKKTGPFMLLPQKAVTSSRRWEAAGPVRNTAVNVIITWAYRLGVSPAALESLHRKALKR